MDIRFWSIGSGCALAFASSAFAQDAIVAFNPTVMVSTAGEISATEQLRRQFGSNPHRGRAALPRTASPARLAFHTVPAVRDRVHARAVEQLRRLDAKEATKLQAQLTSGQFQRMSTTYLARYGLSTTNLADTTALYLATAWLATRGSSADPSRAQMLGLRRQIAATFLANPGLARSSDATKQEISEANLIQADYASGFANAAAANPALRPQVRDAVSRGVMAMYGMDLRRLDLTEQGFR